MLDVILGKDPKNFEAMVYKASVLMSQHQFAQAREVGLKARDINPANAYVYGVLVDANVELGQYEEAIRMSDSMQALKPSLESYSRASYLREIYGDYPGAIQAMKLAVEAGLPGSEPQSWSRNTLAYLYEKTGNLDRAEGEYRTILQMRPSYAFALRGLARVYALRKEPDSAMRLLQQAADIMPEFSFYEEMADLQASRGDKAKANEGYREVIKMLGEDAASGHTVNLELCRVFTKMGALDSAAVYGAKEYAVRPQNIDVNAALAWIAHKRGDAAKAVEHMNVAMRTGSKDPELLWRASEIERTAGNSSKSSSLLAQAKKVNPGLDPTDFQ
jgi:tetratricopeptide (TPR) repeat protein